MNATPKYRQSLFQIFASENYNKAQCEAFLCEFDKIVGTGMSGETAFKIVYSSFGAKSPEKVCRTVKDYIVSELEKLSESHQGIDTNPATRLKKIIQSFNQNVDRCNILLDGVELSKEEIEKIKAKVPSCLKGQLTYETQANGNGLDLGIVINF